MSLVSRCDESSVVVILVGGREEDTGCSESDFVVDGDTAGIDV